MSEIKTGVKQYKPKKRNRAAFVLTVFIIFVLMTVASGVLSYKYVVDSHKEKTVTSDIVIDPQEGIYIDIPMGSSTTQIANILKQKGLIKYPLLFKIVSNFNGYDGMYKSGTHILRNKLSYDDMMRILVSNPVSVRVTIPEGYTFKQIAQELKKKNLVEDTKFYNVANTEKFDFAFIKDIPQREFRLEGYLFPDTYEFDVKAGEKEIVKRMLGRFNEIFKPEYYEKAKKLKMTPDQIIILASIIEREARMPEERKTIAGVFYNRLNNKDKTLRRLQSCATIQYIYLNKEGTIKEKITENDTKIKDPYNTYEIEGLPPGPICSPGKDAIEAALNPEKSDYLYFVAKGDGSHYFSKTLKEHTNAMRKYGVN